MVLKNPKHERFAQGLAKGKTAEQAYSDAGYKPSRSAASRLSTNVNIQSRIAELQDRASIRVEVTVETLAAELDEARKLAMTGKQPAAAVQATMGKAKLFGLGSETRKLQGTLRIVTITAKQLDGLTEDELQRLERAYPVLEKLGIVGGDPGAASEARD